VTEVVVSTVKFDTTDDVALADAVGMVIERELLHP